MKQQGKLYKEHFFKIQIFSLIINVFWGSGIMAAGFINDGLPSFGIALLNLLLLLIFYKRSKGYQ
jgi:hypothetical protein